MPPARSSQRKACPFWGSAKHLHRLENPSFAYRHYDRQGSRSLFTSNLQRLRRRPRRLTFPQNPGNIAVYVDYSDVVWLIHGEGA